MMNYDRELFQKFRAKAVTELSQLEVGKTYFSNGYPEKFVLDAVLTHREMCELDNRSYYDSDAMWLQYNRTDGFGVTRPDVMSASDHNIGMSYNPWLIFENEADALECREQLKIEYEYEPYDWDDMDMYFDPYDGE